MANQENHTGHGEQSTPPEARLLPPIYNSLSVAGCVMIAFGVGAIGFLFVLSLFEPAPLAYAAFTFLPAAGVVFVGLLLIGAGLYRERWRRARGRASRIHGHWALKIDLNTFKQGRVAGIFLLGTALATFGVFALGAASRRGLQYSESTEFCGTVCHSVMHPEAVAYEDSPHARIECVECHVGHERGTFIQAKLNGLRQFTRLVTGKVRRPIPTPIDAQRPSQSMCENCHWPERWIGYKTISNSYFRSDEKSSPRGVRMEVKIGGGSDGLFEGSGIHFHMLTARKVEFIPRDLQSQDIPWVRVTRADGSVTEFNHAANPLSDSEKETLEIHVMGCLDCHNRPAHQFQSPVDSVNGALAAGKISRDLPYIKREGVRALDGNYATTKEALAGIGNTLATFYQQNHLELLEDGSKKLDEAIEVLRVIYQKTIFPEMRADWSSYPNNIGHRDWPGCFRCHNYEMESDEGESLTTSCGTCHSIVGQIEPDGARADVDSEGERSFLHPFDDSYLEVQLPCSACHNGGFRLYQ